MKFYKTLFSDLVDTFLSNKLLRNVSANLIGSGWNGLLIIFATPWYVSILGMEGYGIVGFWILMQIVFSLFDLGLGATLAREFASIDQKTGQKRRRDLLCTLEFIYWPIAASMSIMVFTLSTWIVNDWLKIQNLPLWQIVKAVEWMALSLGLQFPGALYSSGLAGLQCQGRMNALQVFGNTLRHVGGVVILWWKQDPVMFFAWQAFVAAAQTLSTRKVLWRLLNVNAKVPPVFQGSLLLNVWSFTAGMAFTMIAGVILANVDRLFLSKLLPAEELGKYTLAWTLTGFLQLGIQPFYRAYFPRFAELFTIGNTAKLRKEYYNGCRMTSCIIVPFALIGSVFAPEIFIAWIGKADETVVNVFRLLLIGVSGAGLMWLPAGYQQAQGWTRLHAWMIAGALGIGIPCLWWTIKIWGTAGATMIWLLHGISDVTLGLWLMHKRLLPGELSIWYRSVIILPLLICLPLVVLSRWAMPVAISRVSIVIWLGVISFSIMIILFAFMQYNYHNDKDILND